MVDISTNHNPAAIPTKTGAVVSEGTHCTLHPATQAAYTAIWLMDTPIVIYTMTHPNSIVTSHPTLTTSPTDITDTTIPWTRAGLIPLTPTALHRKQSQEKLSCPRLSMPP